MEGVAWKERNEESKRADRRGGTILCAKAGAHRWPVRARSPRPRPANMASVLVMIPDASLRLFVPDASAKHRRVGVAVLLLKSRHAYTLPPKSCAP